jgi:hypothetical protein
MKLEYCRHFEHVTVRTGECLRTACVSFVGVVNIGTACGSFVGVVNIGNACDSFV